MKAVSGVFRSRADAERALSQLRSIGLRDDQVTDVDSGKYGERNSISPCRGCGTAGHG